MRSKSLVVCSSLSGLLAASTAHSGVVISETALTGTVVGDGTLTDLSWDIDGDGNVDLVFDAQIWGSSAMALTAQGVMKNIDIAVPLGAGSGAPPAVLTANALVGPTNFAFQGFGANLYFWGPGNSQAYSTTGGAWINFSIPTFTSSSSLSDLKNMLGGTNLIGFRFQRSGQTHYGFASISIGISDANTGFITINRWGWEDVANTPISASAVPEPGNAAMGLGALALGAAGLRRWRRRRA